MGTHSQTAPTAPPDDRFDPAVVSAALRDPRRLALLRRAQLLDTLPVEMFGRWTAMVRRVTFAELGFVCLVEDTRQQLMSISGGRNVVARPIPIEESIARYVVSGRGPLIVTNAHEHPALARLQVVAEDGLTAYLAAPVVVDGMVLGSVSVADYEPRMWSEADIVGVGEVASAVSTELRLRLTNDQLSRSHELLASHNRVHELIAQDAPLEAVLRELVTSVERQDTSLLACISLLEDGTMRPIAAPSLPPDYIAAIDGAPVDPELGSCGAAAATGERVICADLDADPKWATLGPLVRAAGVSHCWSQPINASDGEVLGTFTLYGVEPRTPTPEHIALMEDTSRITGIAIERHRAARRLLHGATHDALTGLLNRGAILERLEQALARSRRRDEPVAVLFVDLDHLKLLNDTLGHDRTDDVMRAVAGRLRGVVREGDAVGRLGGDEYLVVAEHVGDLQAAGTLAERLREAIAAPIPGLPAGALSASIGVAVVTGAQADARDAIRQADAAMYAAKRAGGDRCRFFEDDPRPRARQRLAIGSELPGAAERGELSLVYQPLYDLRDGRMSGVEALMRWTNPRLGVVSPADFVPVAEETGMVAGMGAWALLEACTAIGRLTAATGATLELSVNVSAHQIADPSFPFTVKRALRDVGFPAGQLTLEITETALVKPDATSAQTLRDLTALGCRIVLDDFGTGYSSLASLKGHPVDGIKIDRSFVDGLPDDREDAAIVSAVIGMAKALGRSVTGEGVENDRQLQALRALGCDTVQGFLLARPLPVEQLQDLLTR